MSELPGNYGYEPPSAPQYPSSAPVPMETASTQYLDGNDGTIYPLSKPLINADFDQARRRMWNKYFRFKGYATRSEFWWAWLLYQLVITALFVVCLIMMIVYITASVNLQPVSDVVALIFYVVVSGLSITATLLIIPHISVTWRRLHDAGFPGPMFFLLFVPVANLAVLFMLLMASNPTAHRPQWDDNTPDPQRNK